MIMQVKHRSQICLDVGLLRAAGPPRERWLRRTWCRGMGRRVRPTNQGHRREHSPGRKSLEGLKAPSGRLAAAIVQGVVVRSGTHVV